ncbi:bifunctional 5,10-methylenetetrahydrofolate dehydrogenase/5,10-methenyltetrahydrofolate cyclohydrolase [Candidatus Aerophobetes bacterium]|uniref:Bifunctional protein FolD n=1 Tax=Aerophobetes bacterium TaxID=2030807 RepID=A0A662D532_UNCAE|nr:MAG: bifunctional 5,10-methylenetetrahydrofolate dehydrogenase/5,10-methenyltetrahydrofolate cyclohydrolase [Candidatus Aerophobetes bacterium]
MPAKIIDGKKIANEIKEYLRKEIEELKKKGNPPSLSAIQVGEDPGSKVYIGAQKKSCEKMGIEYNLHQFDEKVTQKEIADFIKKLNQDPRVSGIILQMPLPGHLDARQLQQLIDPKKDAEGVSPANMGMVVYGKPILGPCTAMAIIELVKSTGVDLYGKEAVMVGHSDIVGKPTALLLLDKFVTTSVCHIATGERGTLPDYVRKAEILIVAVGKANLIKGEWVKEGAIVIDVGINRVGGKIVGDVEFDVARERASYITPVPGGVGPVTTAMLLRNTVEAAKLQLE